MQTRNADPITDRGDYALNNDESGLIRGRIVEEPLMGKNAARRFQKELNEIVEDHVPLTFLPVWQKIRIITARLEPMTSCILAICVTTTLPT